MTSETHNSKATGKPRSLSRKLRRGFGLYVLLPYLAVTVIFTAFQRQLMYQPTVAGSLSFSDVGLNADLGRDVELETRDGETIRGWLLKRSTPDDIPTDRAPLVVYFPGNSLNRHERIADLKEVTRCGFDVLIFDYRGFGDSTGSPSEAGLTADARLVWQYAVQELDYDERNIVVFGESVGGAVALSLWSDGNSNPPHPAALILSSTFASMPETVAWHYPYFPFRFLLLDRWPSIERIPRVNVPVVIFHGTEDQMVPVGHAKKLAKAAPSARFIEISGAGHNDIPMLLRQELAALRGESADQRNAGRK